MDSIATRKVAILVADGVDGVGVQRLAEDLRKQGAIVELLAPVDGSVRTAGGEDLPVDRAINTMASVLYDAVAVPCGPDSVRALAQDGYAVHFVAQAFKHAKPLAAFGSGRELLAGLGDIRIAEDTAVVADQGVVTTGAAVNDLDEDFTTAFAKEIARHRAWERPTDTVPA